MSQEPSPVKPYVHHIAVGLGNWRPSELKELGGKLKADGHGFNARIAVYVSNVLSSMTFFWIAVILACLSLPAVIEGFATEVLKTGQIFPSIITKVALIALIAWIAQTFIQLVALPVLGYMSNAVGQAQEANTKLILQEATRGREHGEAILKALDLNVEGGLETVLAAVNAVGKRVDALKSGGQR